ncbi:Ribonuclease HI [Glycine soja]
MTQVISTQYPNFVCYLNRDKWTVWFDGASNILGHGVGAVLVSPDNQCAAIDSNVKLLKVYGDSALVIHQLRREWETRDPKLIPYKAYIQELAKTFDEISFHHVPREENQMADALATLASMFQLTPHGDLPYIEFWCRGKPAHCCQVEEERDEKPWYFDIKRYVVSKEYPLEIADNDKRTLRRLAAGFFMSGSILYKRNHDMTLLWCVDAREANHMIEERAFSGGALVLTNMDGEELPSPVNSDVEMAPRKLASKRSRKDKAAEGTSSAPEYDSHRFKSAVHQQRFEAIKGWSFLRERRVQLRDDEYTDFQEEIGRQRWTSLVTPMAKFDPEIVLGFYANAWPTEEGVRDMRSWVRGQWIPFDADAIGQLLGYPLVLEEGQECEYGQRRNWSDGFNEEAIAQLLSTSCPAIIIPTSLCQSMAPTRHPLDPDKSNRALGFPALITGLCQSFGVPVAPTKVIRPPITRAFIVKYCTQRQAQGDAPQAAGAPPPPHQAGPAGSFDMEQYLRHLVRQQAANHRAHVLTHDCLYQMSLSMQSQGFASFSCPTPDQFRAEVAWPGDWPEAQAGEAPPEAPGDGGEAHEDEEMADLLDFLGGTCLHFSGENTKTFLSLTSYPELRRSEFLIGGYVGARASLLSTTPPFVATTQELVTRGDTLQLSAPQLRRSEFLIGGYVGAKASLLSTTPLSVTMTQELVARGDTLRLSAPCHSVTPNTVVSDGTQRQNLVILHLLSSRGGGPDDMRRQNLVIPHPFAIQTQSCPMARRDKIWSFCTLCHPEAAGPMTCGDKIWSFRTPLPLTQSCPMARRDKIWSFCTLCHPEAAGPMTCGDKIWSFRTPLPFRHSRVRWHAETKFGHSAPFVNRGRQARPLGPSRRFLQKVVASGGSNPARLGELGGKHLPYFAINRGGSEKEKGFQPFFDVLHSFFIVLRSSTVASPLSLPSPFRCRSSSKKQRNPLIISSLDSSPFASSLSLAEGEVPPLRCLDLDLSLDKSEGNKILNHKVLHLSSCKGHDYHMRHVFLFLIIFPSFFFSYLFPPILIYFYPLFLMQSYPPRVLDRRLQEDWARDAREDPRVLILGHKILCPFSPSPSPHLLLPSSSYPWLPMVMSFFLTHLFLEVLDLLHQWSPLLLEDKWYWNGERRKMIGDATSRRR